MMAQLTPSRVMLSVRGVAMDCCIKPSGLACLPAWCSTTWDNSLVQGFERADRQFLDAAALAEIHALMFVEGA